MKGAPPWSKSALPKTIADLSASIAEGPWSRLATPPATTAPFASGLSTWTLTPETAPANAAADLSPEKSSPIQKKASLSSTNAKNAASFGAIKPPRTITATS